MRAAMLFLPLLAGCAAQPVTGGGGIVSTNPCADAMLVELVPARRIAAISHYSREPSATSISPALARRFRATAGTAEEVIALKPDLVIASSFTPPSTRAAYARAGLRALYLDSPTSIAASQRQVTELARAVGAEARGAAINARLDAAVRDAGGRRAVPALLWIGGDLVSGGGNLLDEMLRMAGFANVAADYGLAFTGRLSAEQVIAHPPRVMLVPDGGEMQPRARALAHLGVPQATFPRRLVNCGGPVIVDAMARLKQIREGLAS